MKWFSVEWSKREFPEQKTVELIFCASDQIRERLAIMTGINGGDILIHTITEYDITVVKGGYC